MASGEAAGLAPEEPLVGVVMGSANDFGHMSATCEVLEELRIPYEKRVVSAHRTHRLMFEYGTEAAARGLKVIIAGAGGAAHLPGMLAANTILPVIGVPSPATALDGFDSMFSIVQMPRGTPVATMAIGRAGAVNAALLAARILASSDSDLAKRLNDWQQSRSED